jgi:hypothetical protein
MQQFLKFLSFIQLSPESKNITAILDSERSDGCILSL